MKGNWTKIPNAGDHTLIVFRVGEETFIFLDTTPEDAMNRVRCDADPAEGQHFVAVEARITAGARGGFFLWTPRDPNGQKATEKRMRLLFGIERTGSPAASKKKH